MGLDWLNTAIQSCCCKLLKVSLVICVSLYRLFSEDDVMLGQKSSMSEHCTESEHSRISTVTQPHPGLYSG